VALAVLCSSRRKALPVRKYGTLRCPDFPLRIATQRQSVFAAANLRKLTYKYFCSKSIELDAGENYKIQPKKFTYFCRSLNHYKS